MSSGVAKLDEASAAPLPMGVPPSPSGVRLERRRWRDPRLLAGVILVLASGVGITWAVNAADDRVAVWVVDADIPAGAQVVMDDLRATDVQVPEADAYWTASQVLGADLIAQRDFAAGELLTRAGVTTASQQDLRNVTLPVLRHQMPADLDVGRRVDVYVVERGVSGEPDGAPRLVLRSAIVAAVDGGSGAFGGTSLEVGVALSVPSEDVAKVLDAQARGTLTLVDVPVNSS
jgi:hypothetical protein